jgi:predicted transcriptional regulator
MKAPKAMTIRLSPDQADALDTVAAVDDLAVVEVIRTAIAEHVEARTRDAEFQRNLRERIERAQAMLRQSKPGLQ